MSTSFSQKPTAIGFCRTLVVATILTHFAANARVLAANTADAIINHEFNWATIGDAGNPGTPQGTMLDWPDAPPRGSVNYEYRMAKTEVSVRQWMGFLQAYLPHFTGSFAANTGLLGHGLTWVGGSNGIRLNWNIDAPTTMNWQYAARYCNWLHNGKATNAAAFETGVYDMSTLVIDPITNLGTMNTTPMPGAKVWIPTLDEWTKAVYWDPNKNGTGQGGYWTYPAGSDQSPIRGLPGAGGQSNAGLLMDMPVGSYPSVMSPWGLLDTSGGVSEMLNYFPESPNFARAGGTNYDSVNLLSDQDRIRYGLRNGLSFTGNPGFAGLRLAASVPAPGHGLLLIPYFSLFLRRTPRCSSRARSCSFSP